MLLYQAHVYRIPFHKFLSALSILVFLLFWSAQAQQSQPDTLDNEEEDLFGVPEDTVAVLQDYLPEDIIFIPSDVLYNHSWDNVNVRMKRDDLIQMDDTIDLIFDHPSESPFVFPKAGKFLSPFGYRSRHFHAGVDIRLGAGDSILCAFDGKVRLARRYRGYGNTVVIRHFNGLETVYAHLQKMVVATNQDVKAGELLGFGGHTGRATGSHLHFETRFLGEPFNPESFIDLEKFRIKGDTLRITASLFDHGSKRKKQKRKTAYSPQSPDSGNDTKTYIIKKGDTLSRIAAQQGTTVQRLCALNNLSKRSRLQPGQKLKVN